MRRSPLSAAVAALAVAGLAACGSSAPAAPVAGSGSTAPVAPAASGATGAAPAKPSATAAAGTGTTPAQPPAATAAHPGAGSRGGKGTKPAAAPTSRPPVVDPRIAGSPDEVPIEATVSPRCVPLGGTVTLDVKTVEKANVAYIAIYSNGENGAPPPFGHGHGGNEAGQADFRGSWTARWVVGPTAPAGDGYVTVVVGAKQKQRSIDVPFSVAAREGGGCGT